MKVSHARKNLDVQAVRLAPYLGDPMTQAGVDLVILAAMLGHSKINMVMGYAHPTEEQQFVAMEKRLRYIAK